MTTNHEEGLTALEALGIAIRAEQDAQDIYSELAARCEDPLVRRRFELLAAEEARHRELLEAKWRELAPEVELKIPPTRLPRGARTGGGGRRMSLLEVLDLALEEESRSREFYLRMEQETTDLSGKNMFRFLADLEYMHWLDLAQERDLVLRYPNYFRRSPTPWRAERSLGGGN